jgi:hypothetical protein
MEQRETRTPKNNCGGTANLYPFPHKFHRANYTDLYLTHRLTEADVLKDIIHLLEGYRVDAAIVHASAQRAQGLPGAGAKSVGTDSGKLPRLKAGNEIPKGFAGIQATLAPDGRALFIEVKQPRCINQCGKVEHHEGESSHEQLEFLRQKQARGALVMVAWSADDVEHYLKVELHRNRRVLQHGENEIRSHLSRTR